MALRERAAKSTWAWLEQEDLRALKVDLMEARCLSWVRVLDLRTRKERKWVWMTLAAAWRREWRV